MIIGDKHLFILCWKHVVHLWNFSIGLLVFLIVEKHFIFWYYPLSDIRFGNVISHLIGFFFFSFPQCFLSFFSTLVSHLHFAYFVYFYFLFRCFCYHFHYIKPTRRVNSCICTPNVVDEVIILDYLDRLSLISGSLTVNSRTASPWFLSFQREIIQLRDMERL